MTTPRVLAARFVAYHPGLATEVSSSADCSRYSVPFRLGNSAERVDERLEDFFCTLVIGDLYKEDHKFIAGARLEDDTPLVPSKALVAVVGTLEPGIGETLNCDFKVSLSIRRGVVEIHPMSESARSCAWSNRDRCLTVPNPVNRRRHRLEIGTLARIARFAVTWDDARRYQQPQDENQQRTPDPTVPPHRLTPPRYPPKPRTLPRHRTVAEKQTIQAQRNQYLGNSAERVNERLENLVGSIVVGDIHKENDEGLLVRAAGLEQHEPLITPEVVPTVVARPEPGVGEALSRYRKVPPL